ncbi:EmrB/QacA subfamily drug resistance transporter [Kibdelosporangium banguiense]|uniref:EmrB/QacA subfamily drug resistance transporter n=1 Tax=Kibdelosporangium banguiense TaxID=1365924 RepID=A0ABS4TRK7_9PSEU|nr:DHA2 family efflux MFS transporter permease subunit [Kibdelosporangium banguiense]MBP2327044.1 EmrB/QacA subfamily drug resistance transporter [Kibdelosporangium banguiense]
MAQKSEAPLTGQARAILTLVIAGSLLVVIDIVIVTVGLPGIQAELGGSLSSIQWVIVAYTVTMGAVTQVVGTLSDRLGRRTVYLTGIVLFTVSSLACGLAPNVVFLDLARGLQGIGGAILMANSLPLISHAFEGQRRNMAIATWSTAATAAGLVAPVLGGVLIDVLDWRAMFLVNVPIGIAAFIMAAARLPSPPQSDGPRPPIDWLGTALLILSLGIGNFALLRGEDQGWGSTQTLVQFGLAVILFIAFTVVQVRVQAPTLHLSLFRVPAFTGAALAIFMSRVLTIGGTVYFVQYFQGSLHLTPTESGLMLVPGALAQMGAGMLAGKLQARLAPGPIIATGYTLKAIAAAWLGFAFGPTTSPWLLALPLLIWGFGGGVAGAPVMSVAMNVVDKQRAGMVGGTVTSLASIGGGVGTAVLGVLYKTQTGSVIAADPAIQGPTREAMVDAAARGDAQAVLALAPEDAKASVQTALDTAIAEGGSAVLLSSAAMAVVTTLIVLVLLNSRNVPGPNAKP